MKMSNRPTCLWSFLVLSLCTVNCDVVYMRVGDKNNFFCKYHTGKHEVSWKFNSQLIGRVSRSGTSEKGGAPMSARSHFSRGYLFISKVEESDAGEYSCTVQSDTQRLSVLTYKCLAQPTGPFFQTEAVNIQCNVMDKAQVRWTCESPSGRSHMASDLGSIKVTTVNISDGGKWECFFEENGQKHIYSLHITVIGLMPSENVTVQEGESPVLPCVLQSKLGINLKPTNIVWTVLNPSPSLILEAESSKDGELKTKPSSLKNVKFSVSKEILEYNFSVTLTNVKARQAGTYRCSVKFDNEKTIFREMMLVVIGQDAPRGIYPGNGDDGSGVRSKVMSILDIEPWIWIVIGVGCVVLIVLVIVITAVIVYKKKKGNKKKARKMRSMEHPLMHRDYCQCNRAESGQPNGKQREQRHTASARSSKESRPAQQTSRGRQQKAP